MSDTSYEYADSPGFVFNEIVGGCTWEQLPLLNYTMFSLPRIRTLHSAQIYEGSRATNVWSLP